MAVTVLGRSALVSGMREIVASGEFPTLPKVDLLLYKAHGATTPAAKALYDYLSHYLDISREIGAVLVPDRREAESQEHFSGD